MEKNDTGEAAALQIVEREHRLRAALEIDAAGRSDMGRERTTNQDQFLIARLHKSLVIDGSSLDLEDRRWMSGASQGRLLLVADGMGGMTDGAETSRLIVETLVRHAVNTMDWFFPETAVDVQDIWDDLAAALLRSKRRLDRVRAAQHQTEGTGTTLTMAYLIAGQLHVVHAGDSRCYVWRHGQLHQLTKDHTVAAKMIEEGMMDPADAEGSQWHHVLWNVVGAGEGATLKPELVQWTLAPGDAILLCSDGLTKHVDDARIAALLAAPIGAEECAAQLIAEALEGGGSDNVTVVVARAHAPRVAPLDSTLE